MSLSKFLKETFGFLSFFAWKQLPWEEFCKVYRQRTLQEIIQSGYFLGCYESALALYERAKKRGFYPRFLEMVSLESWVAEDGKEDGIVSHCYIELLVNRMKILIDPTQCQVLFNFPPDMVLFSEGAYAWASFDEFHEAQKRFVREGFRG